MSATLFVFRPEPGWSATINAARGLGLHVAGQPLSRIEPVAWIAPDPSGFDAILAGSANVFRHGGEGLARLTELAVFAVGETTAAAAREAGFTVERVGIGALQTLLDAMPAGERALLRLCGERRVPLAAPAAASISERVVYRAVDLPIGKEAEWRLREGGVVLLHSGETARHFAAECSRLEIDRAMLTLVLIGPRLREPVGDEWRGVHIAKSPDERALLASVEILCKDPRGADGQAHSADHIG
jgi:uroporphyrinogen-III synthase